MNKFWLIVSFFFLQHLTYAQQNVAHKPGELLVQFKRNVKIPIFQEQLKKINHDIYVAEKISSSKNIYLIRFDTNTIEEKQLILKLTDKMEVLHAQYNHIVNWRATVPNDDFYEDQWNMDIIGAPTVWDNSQGGLTSNGDTIVVAIFDAGCELSHTDLQDNIWRNRFEIPNDGIDNDNNGFIDDYWGWNHQTNNDQHSFHSHGTKVSGIIGAKGDNESGIAGVNWHIKIMIMSGTQTESEIASAANYVTEMRRKYNETNGAEGAFVVAANFSLGIDNLFCNQLPLWEAIYDQMGAVGILGVGATSNANVNVDQLGDIPTSCTSDYLISVTSTNRQDTKEINAGFGRNSIDLGAPGDDIFTATANNNYGDFSNTSFAAPHVTGAIGLLYSLDCAKLATDALKNPSSTALSIKNIILEGVDKKESLKPQTLTGGRLNIANSMEHLESFCEHEAESLNIQLLAPNPADNQIKVNYSTLDHNKIHILKIYDTMGRLVYQDNLVTNSFGNSRYTADIGGLINGIYFLTIDNGDNFTTTKFIIAR